MKTATKIAVVATLVLLVFVCAPALGAVTVLDQPPNGSGVSTADGKCAPGFPLSNAANFVLRTPTAIDTIEIWTVYWRDDPEDDFTIIFRDDVAGVPGPVSNGGAAREASVLSTRMLTGDIVSGMFEYRVALDLTDVLLAPGVYWVEVFNDASGDRCTQWEFGTLDPVHGIPGSAPCTSSTPFTCMPPAARWASRDEDLAIRITGDDPLLATIDSFAASVTEDGVRLTWRTTSEIDNLGFRLFRSDATRAKAAEVAIHAGIIPPQGGGLIGADYVFVDGRRLAPGVYRYWLEDLDLYGRITRHGPVAVTIAPRREGDTGQGTRR